MNVGTLKISEVFSAELGLLTNLQRLLVLTAIKLVFPPFPSGSLASSFILGGHLPSLCSLSLLMVCYFSAAFPNAQWHGSSTKPHRGLAKVHFKPALIPGSQVLLEKI